MCMLKYFSFICYTDISEILYYILWILIPMSNESLQMSGITRQCPCERISSFYLILLSNLVQCVSCYNNYICSVANPLGQQVLYLRWPSRSSTVHDPKTNVLLSYGSTVLCLLSYILWSYCLMSYCLTSYCHMSYGLMSYGHTVICPMVLESYVLWSYPTVLRPMVILS